MICDLAWAQDGCFRTWSQWYKISCPADSYTSNMSVKHLPPVVKQLLTLRNPGLPTPPPVGSLNSVFKSTLDDAKLKRAEKGWITLTVSFALSPPTP